MVALKLYPAGATTNSDAGVTDLRKTYKTLEAMQRDGLLLLVHGEVTSPEIDLFDREAVFIDTAADPAAPRFPGTEDRVRAHHDKGGGAVRARRRPIHRRHHHRAPPAVQPQRDFHRRHPAALLLPAGAQARDPPAGAGRRGHRRQPALLPRHRQRAAPGPPEGTRHRLRRLLHRPCGDGAVRRGLRRRRCAGQARRFCQFQRRRLLRPAAQQPAASRCARQAGRRPRVTPSARPNSSRCVSGEALAVEAVA